MKIGLVSSNRADYSILRPLIKVLNKEKNFNLDFVVTGSHFSKKHGYTFNEINKDKIRINKKIYLNFNSTNDSNLIRNIFPETFNKFYNYLKKSKIKYLILLGDRYEILSIALCSFFLKIPIIHLYGGETTLGSMDNVSRDIISKISKVHLVSNKKYKIKLKKMGIEDKKIHVIGSLAIDNIIESRKKRKYLDEKNHLKEKYFKKNILVTFHPATLENVGYNNQVKNLLRALSKFNNIGIIFTSTNFDPGGNQISKQIKKFIKKNKNSFMVKSLGGEEYYYLMEKVDCVVGNSSSGIMEAPFLNTPTLNIGNRQKGRLMSKSIISTSYNYLPIMRQLKKILNGKKKFKYDLFYGKGGSTKKIIRIFKKL
tara:strand:+ start:2304 stop:3410 length:1107 start_codon:yes stop_codon:yes gene_type:complete